MYRKLAYISTFFALAIFILSFGMMARGQNTGGSADDHAADLQKKKTTYVKSDERTTGETDPQAPAEPAPDDTAAGSPQNASDDGRAGKKPVPKPPSMDSDYIKEVPKDYNLALPAPTLKEISDNINQAIQADTSGKSVGLRLLAASYHYLGVPYKLGGDGVRTTDCSMFTRMSAIRAGLEPPPFRRGAGIQYGYSLNKKFDMRLISAGSSLQSLQPGDFVFFNWQNAFSRARPYGIGHVGLYIGPTKGRAIYTIEAGSPVNKGWRNTKYLVGFGRIVK
ncbi:MAG: C40 family peptidase [Elusimicrobia bacterium]|nr:C40 family peptidase [Elusimicrobiota bacterium]